MTDSNGIMIIKKAYLDPFLDMSIGVILSFRLSNFLNTKAILNALNESFKITNDCPYRTTIHTNERLSYQIMNSFVKKCRIIIYFRACLEEETVLIILLW